MDSSTGISYLENRVNHKNQNMQDSESRFSVHDLLLLHWKSKKGEPSDIPRDATYGVWLRRTQLSATFDTIFTAIRGPAHRNGIHCPIQNVSKSDSVHNPYQWKRVRVPISLMKKRPIMTGTRLFNY